MSYPPDRGTLERSPSPKGFNGALRARRHQGQSRLPAPRFTGRGGRESYCYEPEKVNVRSPVPGFGATPPYLLPFESYVGRPEAAVSTR